MELAGYSQNALDSFTDALLLPNQRGHVLLSMSDEGPPLPPRKRRRGASNKVNSNTDSSKSGGRRRGGAAALRPPSVPNLHSPDSKQCSGAEQGIVTPAAKLRDLLSAGKCLVVPCCWDGLTARLVRDAGFQITFMSGFSVSASRGFPDCQLVSLEEMRQSASVIAAAVPEIPVIGDGDTGYGNCVSVKRTVKAYQQAGLAAIMIEDQKAPKRCGHVAGKEVVDRAEAFARVRAACDARNELVRTRRGDICILARTDARVISLDEAIFRCVEFRKLGADITFLEAPQSVHEMKRYCKEVDGPKMANMLEGGSTPILSTKELQDMGFAMSVRAITLLSASIKAMQASLQSLSEDRSTSPLLLPSFATLKKVVGFDDYFEEEKAYQRSRLFHNLIRTTQRPPGYVAHNISRDPGLVDCTVDPCVDKSSISTVDTNADTSLA
eukprot:g43049.t1